MNPLQNVKWIVNNKTIKFIPDKFNKKSTDMGIIWTNYL